MLALSKAQKEKGLTQKELSEMAGGTSKKKRIAGQVILAIRRLEKICKNL